MTEQPTLRADHDLRDALVTQVANRTSIPAIQIEKDFWLTEILRGVAAWSRSSSCTVVWKGGTSLSKAFQLIHRFSEDVDVVVVLPNESRNNNDKCLKGIVAAADETTGLQSVTVPDETTRGKKRSARFMFATTHSYGGESEGVLLQIGSEGGTLPHSEQTVRSLLAEHADDLLDDRRVAEFAPVTLRVLDPVRTLVEKLVILHHAATEGDDNRKRVTARHYYDVYCILNDVAQRSVLAAAAVDALARDVGVYSRAMELPAVNRPKAGFASSPAFDLLTNDVARTHYHDVVLPRFVWPDAKRPSFDDVCATVRKHAQLL